MFAVEEYNKGIKCKTLNHSINVFHEALEDGDRYYHVVGEGGIQYDICYKGNTEWYEDIVPSYVGKVVPEYMNYDEYDKDSLDLEFASFFPAYIITYPTEYSIAIARVILNFTDKPVYCADERIKWFLEDNARLHMGKIDDLNGLYITSPCGAKFDGKKSHRSDIIVFHNLFFIQYMLAGKKMSSIKYLEYPLAESFLGIGGILTHTSRIISFSESFGWKVAYNGDKVGKFTINDLNRFYKLDFKREECNEQNTIKVESFLYFLGDWRYGCLPGFIADNILQEEFKRDLDEYADAVVLGQKTLGVLIRGTDYKAVGGILSQASVEEIIPLIKEWIDKYGYEKIFLATEDKDVLARMRDEFGGKVVVVAQERHSASEFKPGQIINSLEKEIYLENEYNARVIDTTINYYYALYLLAMCNSFVCSGQNNGWDTVIAMNNGKFERAYKFGEVASLFELIQAQ